MWIFILFYTRAAKRRGGGRRGRGVRYAPGASALRLRQGAGGGRPWGTQSAKPQCGFARGRGRRDKTRLHLPDIATLSCAGACHRSHLRPFGRNIGALPEAAALRAALSPAAAGAWVCFAGKAYPPLHPRARGQTPATGKAQCAFPACPHSAQKAQSGGGK
ncbi:MAG: hypothetical protein Pg6A_14320 [Termitinemataceae bacterium]|nr:MAG: hypothetical protein Pg6A_14320 [Termitinemataceae bacterium]